MNFAISKEDLEKLIDGYLKYEALVACGVKSWSFYHDALSQFFEKPQNNYEDLSKIVAKMIEEGDYDVGKKLSR